MNKHLADLLNSLINIILPRFCCVCGKRLLNGEPHTCSTCLANLPKTHYKGKKNNAIERLLWDDKLCTVRANSYMYYHQKSPYSNIFFHFKYYHHPHIAIAYGRIMAEDLTDTDFFNGIDVLIPVPLYHKRQQQRGYNQSEKLALGISQVTGLPIDTTSVIRTINNPSQTHLSERARHDNVEGIFELRHPENISNKHILLIDDVITTGSTIKACAHSLLKAGGVKISVISLGTSQHNNRKVFADEIYWAESSR